MKQLVASRTLVIPEGVSVEVKARKVRVKGARGEYLVQDASKRSWDSQGRRTPRRRHAACSPLPRSETRAAPTEDTAAISRVQRCSGPDGASEMSRLCWQRTALGTSWRQRAQLYKARDRAESRQTRLSAT